MNNLIQRALLLITCGLMCAATAQAQTLPAPKPVGTYLDRGFVKGILTDGWQATVMTTDNPSPNNAWDLRDARSPYGRGGLYGLVTETQLAAVFGLPKILGTVTDTKGRAFLVNQTDTTLSKEAGLFMEFNQLTKVETARSSAVSLNAELSIEIGADVVYTSAAANQAALLMKQISVPHHTMNAPRRTDIMAVLIVNLETSSIPYEQSILLLGPTHAFFTGKNAFFQDSAKVIKNSNFSVQKRLTYPVSGGVLIPAVKGSLSITKASAARIDWIDITAVAEDNRAKLRAGADWKGMVGVKAVPIATMSVPI